MRRCGRHPQHGAEKTAAAATALLLVLLYVTIEGQPTASGQTYAGQNIIPLSPGELTMYNWEVVEEGGEAALESYCDGRGVQVRAVFGLGLYSVDQLYPDGHTPFHHGADHTDVSREGVATVSEGCPEGVAAFGAAQGRLACKVTPSRVVSVRARLRDPARLEVHVSANVWPMSVWPSSALRGGTPQEVAEAHVYTARYAPGAESTVVPAPLNGHESVWDLLGPEGSVVMRQVTWSELLGYRPDVYGTTSFGEAAMAFPGIYLPDGSGPLLSPAGVRLVEASGGTTCAEAFEYGWYWDELDDTYIVTRVFGP